MKKFIFDVDGTLTPSRKQMHAGFSAEFLIFCCKFDTYLVTGSDKDKTIEQVGSDISGILRFIRLYSGNLA